MSKDAETLTAEAKLFAMRATEVAAVRKLLAKVVERVEAWDWDDSTGVIISSYVQALKDKLNVVTMDTVSLQQYTADVAAIKTDEAEYA